MLGLLSASSRAQLRTFVAALIVFLPGLWTAPNRDGALALGIAAAIGLVSFGLRALQAYWHRLALAHWLGHPFGDWLDSFVQGFLATLLITLPAAIQSIHGLNDGRAVLASVLIGAVNAGIRCVQGLMTAGEQPAPGLGLRPPVNDYSYAVPPAGPPA